MMILNGAVAAAVAAATSKRRQEAERRERLDSVATWREAGYDVEFKEWAKDQRNDLADIELHSRVRADADTTDSRDEFLQQKRAICVAMEHVLADSGLKGEVVGWHAESAKSGHKNLLFAIRITEPQHSLLNGIKDLFREGPTKEIRVRYFGERDKYEVVFDSSVNSPDSLASIYRLLSDGNVSLAISDREYGLENAKSISGQVYRWRIKLKASLTPEEQARELLTSSFSEAKAAIVEQLAKTKVRYGLKELTGRGLTEF
ncbi:MAG: hypothetical protein KDD62_09490 [Bdellovibrionales bacterium]|nr:hypothetical protein [Bdellovibrionales bacterium]